MSGPRHDRAGSSSLPRVILLRRRMGFSYISKPEATPSAFWFGTDNTDTSISLPGRAVREFVRWADYRYDYADQACQYAGFGTLSLTYEGVLERDASHQALRSFFWDCTFPKRESELRSLTVTTTVQDRRTDRSQAAILPDFGNLSSDVRETLLRYPGSCADWRSCGVMA